MSGIQKAYADFLITIVQEQQTLRRHLKETNKKYSFS